MFVKRTTVSDHWFMRSSRARFSRANSHQMMFRSIPTIPVLTAVACFFCAAASAAEPLPDVQALLTRPGKLLFSEDLAEVPHERDKQNKIRRGGWQSGKGKWEIKDGVLI